MREKEDGVEDGQFGTFPVFGAFEGPVDRLFLFVTRPFGFWGDEEVTFPGEIDRNFVQVLKIIDPYLVKLMT